MMDCKLFGLNATGHHLMNLLFQLRTPYYCLFFEPDDWRPVAQRVRGGIVRMASAACRISGVGFGTQGCLEHIFLVVNADGLRAFCSEVRRREFSH